MPNAIATDTVHTSPRRSEVSPGAYTVAETVRANARGGLSPLEIALMALLLTALVIAALTSGERPGSASSTTVVRVSQGDTLWSLAAAHPVPGLSTEQTADLIARINGVETPMLAEGTSIRVPAGENTLDRSAMASR